MLPLHQDHQKKTSARLGRRVDRSETWPRYISAPPPVDISAENLIARREPPNEVGEMPHPLGRSRAAGFGCDPCRLIVVFFAVGLLKHKKPRAPIWGDRDLVGV